VYLIEHTESRLRSKDNRRKDYPYNNCAVEEKLNLWQATACCTSLIMALLRCLTCSLVLLFTIQSTCFAAKFVMVPLFGRSHYRVLAKLGKELVNRGHEVHESYVVLLY